jgi:hypothetical protein
MANARDFLINFFNEKIDLINCLKSFIVVILRNQFLIQVQAHNEFSQFSRDDSPLHY